MLKEARKADRALNEPCSNDSFKPCPTFPSDIYRSARMYYSGTDERCIKPNTYLYSYFSCGLGESEGELERSDY